MPYCKIRSIEVTQPECDKCKKLGWKKIVCGKTKEEIANRK
jgi:hypothetical protein